MHFQPLAGRKSLPPSTAATLAAGQALAAAAIGSFFAGCVGTLVFAAFSEPLSEVAFKFGPAEYFSLMVAGLIGAIALASGSTLKAVGMIITGLLLGLVGIDVSSGTLRFTFDIPELSDGIGFGANARTALITRGLAEMSRLGAALGADPATFMGMAGLGDLVLTCTDNQSRNRRFGMMLGQGMDVQSAQEKIGQVVEGYRNTKEVRELAHRFGVEMPITEEIYQVLYCGKNAREAALTLLGRARKDERSSH